MKYQVYKVEDILEMMLAGHRGEFYADVQKRPGASPINPDIALFYVVQDAVQTRSVLPEICVKYNGFTRAQVWWSPKYNGQWGVVCRKMALKPRRGSARHGYSGYWMLLAHRSEAQMSMDILDASELVVTGAPSMVQFWSVKEFGPNQSERVFGPAGFGAQLASVDKKNVSDQELVRQVCMKRQISLETLEADEKKKKFRTMSPDDIFDELFENADFFSDTDEEQKDSPDPDDVIIAEPSPLQEKMAIDLLKDACAVLSDDEFNKWYATFAKYLVHEDTGRQIEAALRNHDPRISPDFMFSDTCAFVEGLPVGSAMYCGTYVTGFTITDADECFKVITRNPNPEGQLGIYEHLVESKLSTLFQHINFKTKLLQGKLDRLDFWFHNVVRLLDGTRHVFRFHSKFVGTGVDTCNFEQVQTHLRVQDVSELYQHILDMPPLL